MESIFIGIIFVINNLLWMLYREAQKQDKPLQQVIKEVMPKAKTKKKDEYSDVSTVDRKGAQTILDNMIKGK